MHDGGHDGLSVRHHWKQARWPKVDIIAEKCNVMMNACPHMIMLTELLKTECVGGAKFIVRAPDLCSVVHSDSGSDLQVGALRKKEKNKTTQEGIA